MRGKYGMEMDDILNVGENFSGLVVYRRKVFDDPVLTVYYLKGEPVYAESFLIKRRWWEGLLSEEEMENHLFGDAFRYASETYGDKYVEHIKRYAKETISLTEGTVRDFGWELKAEPTEYSPEEIASMFHLPCRESPNLEGTTREKEIASEINALGFPIFYVPGSGEDTYVFFHTIRVLRKVMEGVIEIAEEYDGSIAFVLPLYIVARLDLEKGKVWVVTKNVRRLVFALRYLKPVEDAPQKVLHKVAATRCCRYVIWRSGEETFSAFDGTEVRTFALPEVVEVLDRYLNEYGRVLGIAQSKVPSTVPPKMGKMLLHQMISRNPDINGFMEDFFSRFGITIDYEQTES